MKNTYWQTPSCDLRGVQIKEPPPPPPYTFDGFDTIQHLAGCAGGIDALVSTMELNAITFWKNMVKHERRRRRRRHIKTNLDKKWIMLQSTHLQNEPCIHLISVSSKIICMTSVGVKKQQAKYPISWTCSTCIIMQVLLTVSSLPLELAHSYRLVVRLAIRGFFFLTSHPFFPQINMATLPWSCIILS